MGLQFHLRLKHRQQRRIITESNEHHGGAALRVVGQLCDLLL